MLNWFIISMLPYSIILLVLGSNFLSLWVDLFVDDELDCLISTPKLKELIKIIPDDRVHIYAYDMQYSVWDGAACWIFLLSLSGPFPEVLSWILTRGDERFLMKLKKIFVYIYIFFTLTWLLNLNVFDHMAELWSSSWGRTRSDNSWTLRQASMEEKSSKAEYNEIDKLRLIFRRKEEEKARSQSKRSAKGIIRMGGELSLQLHASIEVN